MCKLLDLYTLTPRPPQIVQERQRKFWLASQGLRALDGSCPQLFKALATSVVKTRIHRVMYEP